MLRVSTSAHTGNSDIFITGLLLPAQKEGECMKQYIFKEIEKFKIQRYCKGCGGKIVVENANRYYCDKCRS